MFLKKLGRERDKKMKYDMEALDELSQKLGIWLSFIDRGTNTEYFADKKSKQSICHALGFPAQTNIQIKKSLQKIQKSFYSNFAPFTIVVQDVEIHPLVFELAIRKDEENLPVSWVLETENGNVISGQFILNEMPISEEKTIDGIIFQKRRVYLDLNVEIGYHSLSFLLNGEKISSNAKTRLIVAPTSCYMPSFLQNGVRVYGFPLQLYALRSEHNWGIGDFSDLIDMTPIAKDTGASLIGINPVNALFADTPQDASPYFSSSRLFLNPLYVNTDIVAEARDNKKYEAFKNSREFRKDMQTARSLDQVQYELVSRLKYKAFDILYETFRRTHLDKNGNAVTKRGKAFLKFCQKWDPFLLRFATFHVLRNTFLKQKKTLLWWRWEKEYRDPDSSRVKVFQKQHKNEIGCILYQQFVAFEQYEAVSKKIIDVKLPIGLYVDLPVGVGENSAEVWSNQFIFMPEVTIGAPPDIFNKKGQDWSLSPFNPIVLKQTGYELFIRIIKNAMQNAGAIRIDHAFGLMRLYLRVKGASGAYLSYPFKDLMGIVALESVRNKCLVIAEDLGTAPDGFYEEMVKISALSFKIFHYQKNWDGLIMPECYENRCLVASGTHDLPSYTAFWKGLDLELAKKMKTISLNQYRLHKKNRICERNQLIDAFRKQGLFLPSSVELSNLSARIVPEWFIPNVYTFLARTRSMILLVRLEDILEQDEQLNLPGTYLEYPNWRYKLPISIKELLNDKRVEQITDILKKERPIP